MGERLCKASLRNLVSLATTKSVAERPARYVCRPSNPPPPHLQPGWSLVPSVAPPLLHSQPGTAPVGAARFTEAAAAAKAGRQKEQPGGAAHGWVATAKADSASRAAMQPTNSWKEG
jgi:hypothetical protein